MSCRRENGIADTLELGRLPVEGVDFLSADVESGFRRLRSTRNSAADWWRNIRGLMLRLFLEHESKCRKSRGRDLRSPSFAWAQATLVVSLKVPALSPCETNGKDSSLRSA